MAGDRLPIYEEMRARYIHLEVGRHRWRDAPTEEFSLPDPNLEDVHVYEPTSPLLRRHVVHDRRSRGYALTATARPRKNVLWPRQGPIFDQNKYLNGQGLGCCTACAGLGLLMTSPFDRGHDFTDADVLDLYRLETRLDDRAIPGQWEPDDTGSYGLALVKALKQKDWITGYRHAFTPDAAVAALQRGPIAVGIPWLNSMSEPVRDVIRVDQRSGVAGGHEAVIDGYQRSRNGSEWVRLTNSWGNWGDDGSAWLTVPDFTWLLSQRGDVVQPEVA